MKIFLTNNQNKGFTLLEVMVAIFVIVVGITGTFAMLPRMLSATSDASSRLTAAYLAQEGIEIIRNIRDTNWLTPADWDAGFTDGDWEVDYTNQDLTSYIGDGRYLNIDAINGLYNYSDGSPTEFKRKIIILKNPPDEIKVISQVEWQGNHFTVEDHIFNWYEQ